MTERWVPAVHQHFQNLSFSEGRHLFLAVTDHRKPPLTPKEKDPVTTLSHNVSFYFLSSPFYYLSWGTVFNGNKSSRHEGGHIVSDAAQTGKCILWVSMRERQPPLTVSLHHDSSFTTPSSAESLVSSSVVGFTDVMTCSPWALHHTQSFETWGKGCAQRILFE